MSRSPAGAVPDLGTKISLERVVLARKIRDRHGVLVRVDGALVAVLVRLDDPYHGPRRGSWAVEAILAFGVPETRIFATLDELESWLSAPSPSARGLAESD